MLVGMGTSPGAECEPEAVGRQAKAQTDSPPVSRAGSSAPSQVLAGLGGARCDSTLTCEWMPQPPGQKLVSTLAGLATNGCLSGLHLPHLEISIGLEFIVEQLGIDMTSRPALLTATRTAPAANNILSS